ncbi:unnamed protein product [Echinostoma caproni]|uniref:Protein kinase domain-containing protein n=1 Tax=Echinostoma caproni TaxID=27848 RepID=A0A183AST8_9TREM|nr:unnamed protein product [Echinostoma caproni]
MWLFTKDSANTVGSLGLGFSSDPVTGFTFSPPESNQDESFSIAGPYGLQWRLRRAQRRKPTEDASILTCSLTSAVATSEQDLIMNSLRQTVKWMKTLRHPNILNWLASTELTGPKLPSEFHIATERVLPLREYLRLKADSGNFNFISSWGLHQSLNPYLPPDGVLVDAWGLGCLIWEIFNPESTLCDRSQLTSTDALQRVPKPLVSDYRQLVHLGTARGMKRRLTVAQFLAHALNAEKGGFFANQYVSTLLFLEEIQLKDAKEKSKFLSELSEQISTFPDDVCRHKVLPHLLNGLRYGSAGIEALIPVLRIIPLLTESEFEAAVLPCLVQLFASPERATRVRLLEQLPNFVQNVPPKVVDSQIFPSVSTGFSDANPLVREATVRAMVHLAPKLTGKFLNEALPRYLIALQLAEIVFFSVIPRLINAFNPQC